MITIDQSLIDAPDFPRDLTWWQHFVPSYVTVNMLSAGRVALGVTGVAHPSQPPKSPAAIRNGQTDCLERWIYGLPRLSVAILGPERMSIAAAEHFHQSDGTPGHRNAPPCLCDTPNTVRRLAS